MPANLEERLERATDSLPSPSEAVTARARAVALAALPRRAARRRFTRGRPLGLIAVGAVVAVALAVALAAPWDSRTPLVAERALAAIGSQPVIHAVVEDTRPHATIVDLASGVETAQLLRTEYWFDDERALLRARITIDGTLQTELLLTRKGGLSELGPIPGNPTDPRLPPALAGFASGYRDALESGAARVIGETRVEGREAVLLEIKLLSPPIDAGSVSSAEVALDAESYEPLRFRYRSGNQTTEWWRVVSIKTLPREQQQFAPPALAEPRPSRQTGTDERKLSPTEAATALDRPAVWPGRDVAGIQLTEIELMKLTTEWTDDRETVSHALALQYGPRRYKAGDEPWLMITETTTRAENVPFRGFGGPDPPPGELKIRGFGDLDGSPADMWIGSMVVDGLYVALESAQRDAILTAARAMAPIE